MININLDNIKKRYKISSTLIYKKYNKIKCKLKNNNKNNIMNKMFTKM